MLGQHPGRELLRFPEGRTDRHPALAHPGRRPPRHRRVHRLVQQHPAAFHPRLPQPRRIRGHSRKGRPAASSLTSHQPCPSKRGNPNHHNVGIFRRRANQLDRALAHHLAAALIGAVTGRGDNGGSLKDGTRLHYLTPAYFKREVLQPYAAEPGKYALSATRLSCLGLWGVDISFNSAGLVEVYLGDLGRKLPAAEWGHWKSYNVLPQGKMDEGRYRRDFLNQPANSRDPAGDLQRARARAADVSETLLGSPIWKPLPTDARAEFESLVGPLSDAPAALGQALLVLTKALVDGIDPAPLKKFLGSYEKDEKSLSVLGRFSDALGGPPELTLVFRKLQNFRSAGGVAHLAGSGRAKAAADLGVTDLSSWEAFESVATRLTTSLTALTELMTDRLSRPDPNTDVSGTD
jgi:hypothetical protein